MQRKRKERSPGEKENAEELKEVKALITEGKAHLDRGGEEEFELAVSAFSRGLTRCGPGSQSALTNQLHHLRGLAQLRLRRFTEAEKDFQEAILTADDKSKIGFYSSLGKCRMEMAASGESNMVRLRLFRTKKQ